VKLIFVIEVADIDFLNKKLKEHPQEAHYGHIGCERRKEEIHEGNCTNSSILSFYFMRRPVELSIGQLLTYFLWLFLSLEFFILLDNLDS
jgi:hypothetical protein